MVSSFLDKIFSVVWLFYLFSKFLAFLKFIENC